MTNSRTALSGNRLNGLFEQFFGENLAQAARVNLPTAAWEDDNAVHVEADLPGVSEKDIDISVHGRVLTIKGERKAEPRGVFDTRFNGQFEQRLGLPAPVDADRVEATLANGVLTLTLPKSEAAKPRRIEIRS